MRRRAKAVVGITLASFVGATCPNVLAADASDENKAIATDLFDKGVKLMEGFHCDETPTNKAKCKEAREDFKRAYELYPAALGALRNLAYVEKGLGMTASAARDFREVARKAPLDPKPERQKWAEFAKAEVANLEPKVPHLTVKVPTDRPAGMKVLLDGTPLLEAAWDTQIDVDPGKHEVRADAPGRLAYVGTIDLGEKQSKSIAVSLEVDTTYVAPTTEKPSTTGPWIVTSIGGVAVLAGLGLGYASMKKKNDACNGGTVCDPDGLSSGKSLANASTVVTGVGAAVLVTGVVWLLLTPGGESSPTKDKGASASVAPLAGPGIFGVSATGRF
jgi:hypothetical protein